MTSADDRFRKFAPGKIRFDSSHVHSQQSCDFVLCSSQLHQSILYIRLLKYASQYFYTCSYSVMSYE